MVHVMFDNLYSPFLVVVMMMMLLLLLKRMVLLWWQRILAWCSMDGERWFCLPFLPNHTVEMLPSIVVHSCLLMVVICLILPLITSIHNLYSYGLCDFGG